MDADLALVVDAWPHLVASVRAALVASVRGAVKMSKG